MAKKQPKTFAVALLIVKGAEKSCITTVENFDGTAEQLADRFTNSLNSNKFIVMKSAINPSASTVVRSDDVALVDIQLQDQSDAGK